MIYCLQQGVWMKFFLLLSVLSTLAFTQERIGTGLNLTVEQQAKMKAYKAEMKACKEKTQMKILSILNDEQKIKYLQMQQNKKVRKGGVIIEKVGSTN